MKRIYESIIQDHFERNREMLFISGPRQVGKTTTSLASLPSSVYFNWDVQDDREKILLGQKIVLEGIEGQPETHVIFDELHKFADWKNFIKGLFDCCRNLDWRILVTGSARLDTYRKGGDSLLGRYFHLQMFPLSTAELVRPKFSTEIIQPPMNIDDNQWENLQTFGGFPQPFLKANQRFHRQWCKTRFDRLFQEDIRTLGQGYDVMKISWLAEFVTLNATCSLNYSSYARKIKTSVETVQRWITLLEQLSFCFTLRPWHKNISRSIIKEPKIFLHDWSTIKNVGKRNENMVACALNKAVQAWNDTGLGDFNLFFIRTKDKKEVDFLVSSDGKPWFLLEVKTADTSLSGSLACFQKQTGALHAFQVVFDLPYRDINAFSFTVPVVIPARSFLSQLI